MEPSDDRPISVETDQRSKRHFDTDFVLEALASEPHRLERKLNVLQVCSARQATYGAVASMMTLANELRARDHDVRFLSFKGRGLGQHLKKKGFEFQEVRVRFKIDPWAIVKMARQIKNIKADLVHCHLSTSAVNGALAAKLARVPSVSTVHGMSGKLSFLPSTHLIAVSGEVRRHLVAQGVHESKVSIVPNGIELPVWSPEDRPKARETLNVGEETPLLGTTARLTPLKGLSYALYAVAQVREEIPNVRYAVFGDGSLKEELFSLANNLGLSNNVNWMGYRTDMQSLLPGLDLFLFPSLREAMGISIVEAMAAKVPTVATTIGGIPEVVTAETGSLVPPADPIAMSDAIISLLRDPARRQAAGHAAWERAHAEFSAQRMAARTLGVYAAILDQYTRA